MFPYWRHRMTRRDAKRVFVLLIVCCCSLSQLVSTQDRRLERPPSGVERRVALVVGNDGYLTAPLRNARNDARDVGRTLESLGFTVTLLQDVTRQTLGSALSAF